MYLKNLTKEVSYEGIFINQTDINRPALQLTGYFEHFANERVQIIGVVELSYLNRMEYDKRKESFEAFVSKGVPCIIFTT